MVAPTTLLVSGNLFVNLIEEKICNVVIAELLPCEHEQLRLGMCHRRRLIKKVTEEDCVRLWLRRNTRAVVGSEFLHQVRDYNANIKKRGRRVPPELRYIFLPIQLWLGVNVLISAILDDARIGEP